MPSWLTHDNGGRPFRVEQKGNNVCVYKADDEENHASWNTLIKCYEVDRVFVGKSPLNDTTKFSGGHGKRFDGNSMLLKLKGNRYVFIGGRIYEFSPPEPITEFYSTVGPSDVPYPISLSRHYVFFMLDPPRTFGDPGKNAIDYYRKSNLEPVKDWTDPYGEYYLLRDCHPFERDCSKVTIKKPKTQPIKIVAHRFGFEPMPMMKRASRRTRAKPLVLRAELRPSQRGRIQPRPLARRSQRSRS